MQEEVKELRPYDPHRAAKNVEVGDYHFKRRNWKAALSRYEEALEYKPNDAWATFRMGETYEKLGQPEAAKQYYLRYLKVLPRGEKAPEARKALGRLGATAPAAPTGAGAADAPSGQAGEQKKKSLGKHLKEHFSDWCVSAVIKTCTRPSEPPPPHLTVADRRD